MQRSNYTRRCRRHLAKGSHVQLNIFIFKIQDNIVSLDTFRATVCKTVRPMLSDRCLTCLSVLSVTLGYCGQTVGWIKMKLAI